MRAVVIALAVCLGGAFAFYAWAVTKAPLRARSDLDWATASLSSSSVPQISDDPGQVAQRRVAAQEAPPISAIEDAFKVSDSDIAEPAPEQARAYRRIRRLVSIAGDDLPKLPRLTRKQWDAVLDLEKQLGSETEALCQQRGLEVLAVAEVRAGLGQMERAIASVGVGIGRQMNQVEKTLPGQIVARRVEGGVDYVIRINPGDSDAIDALSADIDSMVAILSAGIHQIFQSR